MELIPLQAVPNQALTVNLEGQVTQINIYQKALGLFVDVYVDNILIIGGVIAENLNRIVRSIYLGFIGDLAFIDTQGTTDPVYTGLGSRYSLAYITAAELEAARSAITITPGVDPTFIATFTDVDGIEYIAIFTDVNDLDYIATGSF